MSGIVFAKFFWSDWMSDAGLRRCSYAAKGLWMDMLCLIATAEKPGYLMLKGQPLTEIDIARMTGGTEAEVKELLAELERNNVFSRDRQGKIISRRIIRDEKNRKQAKKNGSLGGNPKLGNRKGKPPPVNPSPNPQVGSEDKTHKPAANNHKPVATSSSDDWGELERKLRKAAGWENEVAPKLAIVGPFVELIAQGASLEIDILPTVKAIAPRAKHRSSWAYFVDACREAWRQRLATGGAATPPPVDIDRKTWQRIAEAVAYPHNWSWMEWGPAPGEDGCLMPADLREAVLAKWKVAA